MEDEANSQSSDSENEDRNDGPVTSVDLGFIETEPEDDAFLPLSFPSKIGGKPVWLDPRSVIGFDLAKCDVCSGPLVLLTQVYCPLPNREKDSYYRTIYVFMCPRRECCSPNSFNNFKVFRSQLPEDNPIYRSEDSSEKEKRSYKHVYEPFLPSLCVICGLKGPFRCSRCKNVSYCSRQHQIHDWIKGGHKSLCNEPKENEAKSTSVELTLPQFEVYIAPEPAYVKKDEENGGPGNLDVFTKEQTEVEETDSNLESQITSKKDPVFTRFLRRIKRRPTQIIRYELGASALWPSSDNQPKDDVPKCSLCGANRQFEFQIMPQLLTYLRLDGESVVGAANGIDWATLAIYTCSANCETVTSDEKLPCCVREFLWKQDYSE